MSCVRTFFYFLVVTMAAGAGAQSPENVSGIGPSRSPSQADWYSFDIEKVPSSVIEAAKEAKPGVVIKKYRLTNRSDEGVFILVGRYYGAPYRFNVTASGEVISVVELDKR